MIKRKFRSDRLFKILEITVGVITLLAFMSSFYFYRLTTRGYFWKPQENCLQVIGDTVLVACGPDIASLNKWTSYYYQSVYFGLLLPTTFFIGQFIFNYIFPKKSINKTQKNKLPRNAKTSF
jgi:hypothetical protein